MNDGWVLSTGGPGDRIGVVREGFTDPYTPKRNAVTIDNRVLYGQGSNPLPGHGFAACTPTFEQLGITEYEIGYAMNFRYMLLSGDFCYTIPLASPDLTLVVSECTANGDRGRLGVVDPNLQNFRSLGEITVDEWHRFHVTVMRTTYPGVREVTISVDGEVIDRHLQREKGPYAGMAFVDLPNFPVDPENPDPSPLPTPQVFGAGYWDDVSLSVLRETGPGRGRAKKQITVDPNPFNPLTTISMELDAATPLQAVVFDVRGRRVRELFAGTHPAGPVRLQWNGQDDRGRAVSSGTYLFRITTPTETRVARAVLVR